MTRARRDTIVTLADTRDVFNFMPGVPVQLVLTRDGVRLERWYEGVARRVRSALLRATRWFRPRHVVSEIDHGCGTVTVRSERWSWRRWRWELA